MTVERPDRGLFIDPPATQFQAAQSAKPESIRARPNVEFRPNAPKPGYEPGAFSGQDRPARSRLAI